MSKLVHFGSVKAETKTTFAGGLVNDSGVAIGYAVSKTDPLGCLSTTQFTVYSVSDANLPSDYIPCQ